MDISRTSDTVKASRIISNYNFLNVYFHELKIISEMFLFMVCTLVLEK